MQNNLLISILFLSFCTGFSFAQFRIDIESEEDLVKYGYNAGCHHFDSLTEISCKDLPPSVFNPGYWSSCALATCELVISVGNLRAKRNIIPMKLDVLGFVQGINADIRVRYRLTPSGPVVNLNPIIENDRDWQTVQYVLPELEWTFESVLYVRLTSGPHSNDIDIVDKIVLEYGYYEGTTEEVPISEIPSSEVPSEAPTTEEPTTQEPTTQEPTTESPPVSTCRTRKIKRGPPRP